MEEKEMTCADCMHFKQHYIKWGDGYRKTSCGSCPKPHLRTRKLDKPICERFVQTY